MTARGGGGVSWSLSIGGGSLAAPGVRAREELREGEGGTELSAALVFEVAKVGGAGHGGGGAWW